MTVKLPDLSCFRDRAKHARRTALVLATVVALSACADDVVFEDDYPTKGNTADAESGSIFETITLNLGGLTGGDKAVENGLAVNADLWRAALDTLSFMPLVSADPNGGVIITDWYNDPSQTGERFKVNVVISGRTLRADALRVTLFKQEHRNGSWVNAEPTANVGRQLENLVLTRARDFKVARQSAK